jgi:hypothetical protein
MATSAPLQARHSDDYDSDEDPDDSNDAQLYRQLMGPSSRGARCVFVDPTTNVACNYAARSHSVKRHIEARHLGIKSVVPSNQVCTKLTPLQEASMPALQPTLLSEGISRAAYQHAVSTQPNLAHDYIDSVSSTGANPYGCDTCGQVFNDRSRLHRHKVDVRPTFVLYGHPSRRTIPQAHQYIPRQTQRQGFA